MLGFLKYLIKYPHIPNFSPLTAIGQENEPFKGPKITIVSLLLKIQFSNASSPNQTIHVRSCLVHSLVCKKKYFRPLDHLTLFYNTVKNNENFRKMTIFKWLPEIQFSTDFLFLELIFFRQCMPFKKETQKNLFPHGDW